GEKLTKADFTETQKELVAKIRRQVSGTEVLSYLLYPHVFLDFEKHVTRYDNTAVIPTPAFFYGLQSGEEISVEIEPGKTLIIKFLTTGEAREDGMRTVFFELNGQPREVVVADRGREATIHRAPKADADNPHHIGAPMPGKVSSVAVSRGQTIKQGDRLLSIEAMKMETAVYSPREAIVKDVLVKPNSVVAAHDLLVILEG
ncbi:MAG TPA: biotin/lipoyl-containing protein, partial [Tepidisphaeraceae bacterium]|nr:biotin/lipoyl-containing protein [Tepidisphaeraceae bacterium]